MKTTNTKITLKSDSDVFCSCVILIIKQIIFLENQSHNSPFVNHCIVNIELHVVI